MKRILIGGFGGQGVILMAMIIGKAAAVFEEKFSTMMQSFGPEARGGACSAQLIISDKPIAYPYISSADVCIFMNQESCDRYIGQLKPGGVLIANSDLVKPRASDKEAEIYSVAANSIAEELGRLMVANIVMCGFAAAVADMDAEACRKAIKDTVKKDTIELNIKAFERGFEAGKKALSR